MRMWMVDPEIMCQKHLCGEHVELHMFIGHLKKGKRVDGYLKNNCLQPLSIMWRHHEIASEMIRRGYKHKSEIFTKDFIYVKNLSFKQQNVLIDKNKSLRELIERCPKCRRRYEEKINRIALGN